MEVIVNYPAKKVITIDFSLSLGELAQELKIDLDQVLILVNDAVIVKDVNVKLNVEDKIQILPNLMGG